LRQYDLRPNLRIIQQADSMIIKDKNKNKNYNFNAKIFPGKKAERSYLGILNKFLFIVIIINGIYFVASVNDLSIKGFVLRELRLKSEELQNNNKLVTNKVTELESYENIQKRALGMNLVKAGTIEYITVISEAVARK